MEAPAGVRCSLHRTPLFSIFGIFCSAFALPPMIGNISYAKKVGYKKSNDFALGIGANSFSHWGAD